MTIRHSAQFARRSPEAEQEAWARASRWNDPFSIELSGGELRTLEAQARRYTLPYRDVVRAKIVLMAAQGMDNDEIAWRLDTRREIVSKWRKRFFEERIAGLEERPRLGRPGFFPPRGGGRGQGRRV